MNARSIIALLVVLWSAGAHAASVLIEDLTWPEVQSAISAGKTVAIYYAGSAEQNGPHMAIGKHNFIAREVAQRIAAELGNALVYPIMPYAPTGDAQKKTGHMRFPGTVTVSDDTYGAVARDVARSALAAGFTHVVLMGDHGGGQKALEAVARELDATARAHGARVHYIGDLYFKSAEDSAKYLKSRGITAGTHASVSDTSQVMAIDRDSKWVHADRIALASSANGVEGDPRGASAEIGRELLAIKVRNAVAQIRQALAR